MMFEFWTALLCRPECVQYTLMKSLAEYGSTPLPVKPWEEEEPK